AGVARLPRALPRVRGRRRAGAVRVPRGGRLPRPLGLRARLLPPPSRAPAHPPPPPAPPPTAWLGWYRSRLIRLLPMYWVAHLVYLVSPFQARFDALDYRFVLSFLGDRVVPIGTLFYYFTPALWYFGLLLQLYLVFPLLF